jgi:hypothetical protein
VGERTRAVLPPLDVSRPVESLERSADGQQASPTSSTSSEHIDVDAALAAEGRLA